MLGSVASVHGNVVEVLFTTDLPPVHTLLRTTQEPTIVVEVFSHSGHHCVKGIALTPTQGLSRGTPMENTHASLKAPVGNCVLGRMFNVFGEPIDNQPPPQNTEWWPVHRSTPELNTLTTRPEVFFTGIKIIDLLAPLERGGKAGLFGGAGVGKTVLLTEMIHNVVAHHAGVSIMCTPGIVGEKHYNTATKVRETLAQYEELKDIVAMLGIEQLSQNERALVLRARRLERFLTQPFFTTEHFTGITGQLVHIENTLSDCNRLLNDELSTEPETAFYLIGTLPKSPEKSKI